MLLICEYGGSQFKCMDIFKTVLTDEGLCCAFNVVNQKFFAQPKIKLASYIYSKIDLIFTLKKLVILKKIRLSSNRREFNESKLLDTYANDWTPELGFSNEKLKYNKYGSPRAVVGKLNKIRSFCCCLI